MKIGCKFEPVNLVSIVGRHLLTAREAHSQRGADIKQTSKKILFCKTSNRIIICPISILKIYTYIHTCIEYI